MKNDKMHAYFWLRGLEEIEHLWNMRVCVDNTRIDLRHLVYEVWIWKRRSSLQGVCSTVTELRVMWKQEISWLYKYHYQILKYALCHELTFNAAHIYSTLVSSKKGTILQLLLRLTAFEPSLQVGLLPRYLKWSETPAEPTDRDLQVLIFRVLWLL